MNHIAVSGHQISSIFQIVFKVEAALPYSKSVFFNIYSVNLCIQSKYRKIQTRKISVFGNFSRSAAQWKRIFQLVETFFFFLFCFCFFMFRGFSSQWKLSLKLMEANCNDHILTNATDFLASGVHSLSFSQTTVNYCQWKQFILQLEHIFQPILHPEKTSFLSTGNIIVLFQVFSTSGN